MSPLRFIGSLLVLSRHRIRGQAAPSASLSHHRLPHGGRRAMAVTGATLCAAALVGVGGILPFLYSKADHDDDDDMEKSVVAPARELIHQQEVLWEEEPMEEKVMKKRFEEWMIKYERTYKDKEEKAMRYELFKRSAQRVDRNNAERTGLTFATLEFSDRTREELRSSC